MEGSDNLMEILKSITPIKKNYSKRNRELDRTFKNVSLGSLIKNLNSKIKYKDEFSPSPEYLKNKNKFEINFKNSYTYIKELSDINNLPILAKNKYYIKNGLFKDDFDFNFNIEEEKKKEMIEKENTKKDKFKERLKKLKILKRNGSDIYSIKNNSDFDFIKKKAYIMPIPSSLSDRKNYKEIFKYSNKKMKSPNENKSRNENIINKYTFKQEQNQKQSSNKNNKINSNILVNSNKQNINNNSNSKLFNESYSNRSNLNKNQFIDFNNNNSKQHSSRNDMKLNKRTIIKNLFNNNNNENGNSFTNSDYHSFEINKSTNIEDITFIYHDKEKIRKSNSLRDISNKNIKLPKIKKLQKNVSKNKYIRNNGIKNSIYFDKMPGRDDYNHEEKNYNIISYSPNYDFFRPHIHSPIFSYKKNPQNYKKFKTGQIIRGYHYSPDKYFVFEFNKKKTKKFDLNRERKKILEILRKKFE